MIARIWHGYTSPENADAYERLLKEVFLPDVEAQKITGYKKFELLRREENNEVAFITIMWFENIEHIRSFAGKEYEKAVIHPQAQALLKRYDKTSAHYEVKHQLNYT